jgi:hypothetical protein
MEFAVRCGRVLRLREGKLEEQKAGVSGQRPVGY